MTEPQLTFSHDQIDAVLFDLDGVVTDTAEIHAAAWKQLFDAYLDERPDQDDEDHRPFDADDDYRRYVDGRPRVDGVRQFLRARGIELPDGEVDDPPDRETLYGLGNRKNRWFRELLGARGLVVHQDAVDLLKRLRESSFATAVVTASKNCGLILDKSGLADLFDARVDGLVAAELGLPGKPQPDTFLEGARRLGIQPGRAAVLEDAAAGVRAASRGGFALSIGIDRSGRQHDALLEHGADLVLPSLEQVGVAPDSAGTPALLADLTRLSAPLAARRPALFLDYDGTLTPIVERPEDALLAAAMREALRAAAAAMPTAIVSGRDLEDVRDLVGLPNIIYAGSHGFEIRGPDLHLELPEGVDAADDLQQAADALRDRLSGIPGVRIEQKRFAIAVHVRQVAEADLPPVEDALREVAQMSPQLRRTGGKKVHELRPNLDWDKGRAVHWLLDQLGLANPDVLPIYIGDDETDEDAFAALRAQDGIGILVAERPQPSAASYRIPETAAVERLLRHLTALETSSD